MRKLCVSEWVASAGLAPADPVCTHPSGSLLTLGASCPAPCTARTPRRFTRPTRWLLPAVGFLKCAHICPRSKRESARLPVTCALGHLLGTHKQPLTQTLLYCRRRACGLERRRRVAKGGSEGTPHAAKHSAASHPRIFSPAFDCSDELSNYLDSRHDTSVADSSSSLGCGSEQFPPAPSSCPCTCPRRPALGEGMTTQLHVLHDNV